MRNRLKCILIFLLPVVFGTMRAQTTPVIRTLRTTVYQPVKKDTAWVKGKVVDNIYFVKYDRKGRMAVENILEPDGSPQRKIVYRYNDAGQVVGEIYAKAKAGGVVYYWTYGYDAEGRINTITTLDGKRDTIGIVTAMYGTDGKVEKKLVKDYRRGDVDWTAVRDTTRIKRQSALYMQRWQPSEEQKEVVTEQDEYGNWLQKVTYKEGGAEPEFINCRNIVYEGMESDREKVPLRGLVKRVKQYSYVAVPKGPETVLRGEKKGRFFVYEFDEQGRKVREETFTDTGKPVGIIGYTYNEDGELQKEIHQTAASALKCRLEYLYDDEGLCKNASIYNAKGEITGKILYRYDLEGNRIWETEYAVDGTKVREYRYIYDSYGQRAGRKIIMKPVTEPDVYPYRRAWNFQGRMTEEREFLPGGGYNDFAYWYNKKGEVISGTEQLNGGAEVKYVYKFYNDKQDNWKIRIKYVDDIPLVYEEREYVYYK